MNNIFIKTFFVVYVTWEVCKCKSIEPESSDQFSYDDLYTRLKDEDFGFARFEEPCDDLSVEELEGFIDLRVLIIKQQEADGIMHTSVMEHLRPKLKYFYDRLKLHCDYRLYQVCHKVKKTCACPHSSMIRSSNQVCGFNLGKRCDFSPDRLLSFGILMPHSEIPDVTCVGNAECVSSFGAAKKICRCPVGYYGPQCKQSRMTPWSKGRSMHAGSSSASQGNQIFANDLSSLMFPDDVKKNLENLMALRNMFEPSERAQEAAALYAKMDADDDHEDYVIRNIFIRNNATLQYGQGCDPAIQDILDNPPLAVQGHNWIDPKPADVKKWQFSLLQSGQQFCSFINYFRCDSIKQVCECKPGLEYVPINQQSRKIDINPTAQAFMGQCLLKIGSNCGPDYISAFEFDPLRNLKRFSPPYSPRCVAGATCQSIPLLYTKHCRCAPNHNQGCDSQEEERYKKVFKEISNRFALELGSDCDPDQQNFLLNPQDLERSNLQVRMTQLEGILSNSNLSFCNLDKQLMCDDETKKCVCFEQLLEQDGECKVKNFDNCEDAFVIGKDLYVQSEGQEGVKMWKVEEVFAKKFTPGCVNDAICDTETSKCACSNGKAGEACQDNLSEFAKVLSPYRIIGQSDDAPINEIFYKLNLNTGNIEDHMVLNYGQLCPNPNPQVLFGERLDRIVEFYREVGHSDDNVAGTKSLHQYDKANVWAMELVGQINRTGSSFPGLCNAFLGLTCHEATGKCRCPPGMTYEDNRCKLNPSKECDENPVADWMLTCRNNSACVPSGYNFKYTCNCIEGWNGEYCQEKDEESLESFAERTSTAPNEIGYSESTTELSEMQYHMMGTMIHEIVNHRRFMVGQRCYLHHEDQFLEYFPKLPTWNVEVYKSLPHGPMDSYNILQQIYKAGFQFCSRRDYLDCVGGWCRCKSQYYGLIEVDNECRVEEYAFCGEFNTMFDNEYPLPKCKNGTSCLPFDYGIHKCLKNARERG